MSFLKTKQAIKGKSIGVIDACLAFFDNFITFSSAFFISVWLLREVSIFQLCNKSSTQFCGIRGGGVWGAPTDNF